MKQQQPFSIASCLFIILLFSTLFAAAQPKPQVLDTSVDLKQTWWLQFNPLTLAEPETAIAITGLYKLNTYWAVALEAGFFIAKNNFENQLEKYSGIRLKPELKLYPMGKRKGPSGMYVALQGLYKNTSKPREEWLSRQDANGQIIFNQLIAYKEKKTVWGMAAKWGWEITPGHSKKWMIDVYTGIGARYKRFKAVGLPDGITIDFNNNNTDRVWDLFSNGIYPTISLGFKFGFRIN